MRAHFLQHVPFEGLGSIEAWLRQAEFEVSCTQFFADPRLPNPSDFDLIIVLGGPMSVNDEEELTWLRAEKEFIRKAVHSDIPLLGVCLGAQLIANALGSPVYPGLQKEIGWFPVTKAAQENSAKDYFTFPPEITVFHWHGETFDLPKGAVRLASTPVCANQAFQVGQRTIGLQFHLEATPHTVKDMVKHCADELVPAPFIQSAETISDASNHFAAINNLMNQILNYLIKKEC